MVAPPKKVLITGASGYVGQHLIASLCAEGIASDTDDGFSDNIERYELYCAYHSLPTFEADLRALLEASPLHPSVSGVTPIPGIDFASSDYIDTIQSVCGGKVDAIVHLAALSSPGFCEKNADAAWKVNVPTDLLALDAPIVYMSTDQVYEGTKQFYKEDGDETVPVNVYGRTKLAFERVLSTNDEGKGALLSEKELGGSAMPDIQFGKVPRSVILRSSLILGPPTPLKSGCKKGDFPSFLQFIESRLQSATPTDYFLNEFRSVVFIGDVVDAIRHFVQQFTSDGASDSASEKCRLLNLGGSTRASRYDIALEVANCLLLDSSSANAVDRPSGGTSPPDISMNVEQIAKALGREMKGLKEIVASTYEERFT